MCHESHEASGHLGEEDIGLASSEPCKGCGSARNDALEIATRNAKLSSLRAVQLPG